MKKKLFCEICPLTYAISAQKERWKRYVRDAFSCERFAQMKGGSKHGSSVERLPVVVFSHSNYMIKRGPDIDPQLQLNKADNIRLACSKIDGVVVQPGETFSFWHLVGETSRRNGFAEGRVLVNGKLVAGVGGGLCNLANTLHLLVMHSPLTITELHHHSDALSPDPKEGRVPYSAGTSVNYNYIDYRFRNDTKQPFQVCTWCEGDDLHAELRTTEELPMTYRITEEDHRFRREDDGHYYRCSRIYRETLDSITREVVHRELMWDNHSRVMYDAALIPQEWISER